MVVYCSNNQLSSVSWVPILNPFQALYPRTHLTDAYYSSTYIYWSVLSSVYFKHAPLPRPHGHVPANQTWLYLSGKLTELYFDCETPLSTFWKWTTLYKLYVYLQNLERIQNRTESPLSWSPHTWSQIEEKYVKFPTLSRIMSVGHKVTNRKWFPSVSHTYKTKSLRKCT